MYCTPNQWPHRVVLYSKSVAPQGCTVLQTNGPSGMYCTPNQWPLRVVLYSKPMAPQGCTVLQINGPSGMYYTPKQWALYCFPALNMVFSFWVLNKSQSLVAGPSPSETSNLFEYLCFLVCLYVLLFQYTCKVSSKGVLRDPWHVHVM